MNPKDKAEAAAREAMASSTPGTRESVTAAATTLTSREELYEAMQGYGWAVFPSRDGTYVVGAPKGQPTADGCPCCSDVEMDSERTLTGEMTLRVDSATWGDGPIEERGFWFRYQGTRPDLEGESVVMDGLVTPEEALAVLEECVREAAIAESREAVETALLEAGYTEPKRVGEKGAVFAVACVNPGADSYPWYFDLEVTPGGDQWEHVAFSHAPPGVNVHLAYRTPPGVVPSPARVAEDLVRRGWEQRSAEVAYEEYVEAKSECGPGEEPDMDEWRRKVAEYQQAERKRRERLNKATGGASWGMFGGVAHPNGTGTTLAYCGECGGLCDTGVLEEVGDSDGGPETYFFRPIHKECLEELQELQELQDERFEGSTLPAPDEVRSFGVWVKDRGDGEVMFVPYEPTTAS